MSTRWPWLRRQLIGDLSPCREVACGTMYPKYGIYAGAQKWDENMWQVVVGFAVYTDLWSNVPSCINPTSKFKTLCQI